MSKINKAVVEYFDNTGDEFRVEAALCETTPWNIHVQNIGELRKLINEEWSLMEDDIKVYFSEDDCLYHPDCPEPLIVNINVHSKDDIKNFISFSNGNINTQNYTRLKPIRSWVNTSYLDVDEVAKLYGKSVCGYLKTEGELSETQVRIVDATLLLMIEKEKFVNITEVN